MPSQAYLWRGDPLRWSHETWHTLVDITKRYVAFRYQCAAGAPRGDCAERHEARYDRSARQAAHPHTKPDSRRRLDDPLWRGRGGHGLYPPVCRHLDLADRALHHRG